MDTGNSGPRSLIWATDIDVLPVDRELLRGGDHWRVRSPSNPGHYWGNLLIFDRPPAPGDRERWEAAFTAGFPALTHRTFAWDVPDGELGAAHDEFPDYALEIQVGLTAAPRGLTRHPRADRQLEVRALDPDADGPLWEAVAALRVAQEAAGDDSMPPDYAAFVPRRLAELRELFRAGRGAWFVTLDGDLVVGSLGVVVTDGRARYQNVDTRRSHRGRGIASRLVVEAAERVSTRWPVGSLVIAALPDYHALGIYESLGFRRTEQVSGVCRWPGRGGD